MLTKMPKILLIGGGITSSLVASLLHQSKKILGHERSTVEISIWDKARGTGILSLLICYLEKCSVLFSSGGRMSTSRSPFDSKCTVDTGAQYISCTSQYTTCHKMYLTEIYFY